MPNGIYIYVFSLTVLLLAVIIDKGRTALFRIAKVGSLVSRLSTSINKLYNEP